MTKNKHTEKRKYRRMRKPAIVRFQEKIHEMPAPEPDKWNMGAVLNIGAGGVLFYHAGKVDIDSVLHLKICMHNPESTIDCIGKVIRVEEIPHMHLIAVVFSEIGEKERNMLKDMAKDFHPEPTND
ncbi:MAG: PilZ domain-containing protein [Candidatus Omnitrophota bacterium]|jgi:hypothetical protein